jgi:hypothetical protein
MACGRTARISYRLHVDELMSSLLLREDLRSARPVDANVPGALQRQVRAKGLFGCQPPKPVWRADVSSDTAILNFSSQRSTSSGFHVAFIRWSRDDTDCVPSATDLMNPGDLADVLAHAAVNVCALLALMVLYARRHEGRELMMVYVCFNVGLFAALVAITAGHFPAGVGFGLFGVLSIIRLRSQPFTTAQIGYFFLVLVLALVNGLSGRDLVLSAALSAWAVYFFSDSDL